MRVHMPFSLRPVGNRYGLVRKFEPKPTGELIGWQSSIDRPLLLVG